METVAPRQDEPISSIDWRLVPLERKESNALSFHSTCSIFPRFIGKFGSLDMATRQWSAALQRPFDFMDDNSLAAVVIEEKLVQFNANNQVIESSLNDHRDDNWSPRQTEWPLETQ